MNSTSQGKEESAFAGIINSIAVTGCVVIVSASSEDTPIWYSNCR